MTPDSDKVIRAKVVRHLHRSGVYYPGHVPVAAAASAVATHDRGQAKALTHEMAQDDSSPLIYRVIGDTVCLEDDRGWVAAFVRDQGGDEAVPWDLKDYL